MDLLLLLKALILGIVEGLTEFLPVSSTGHLILAGDLLNFNDERGKLFEIIIQPAALLAVVWEHRQRIGSTLGGMFSDAKARKLVINLMIAFVPAAVMGLLFGKAIKAHLFNPVSVSLAFIVGAFLIIWAEKREHNVQVHTVDEMGWMDALLVGLAQCLALVPGTSRSGATIIGGLFLGMSRQAATEFSFFLAIPTLFAASGYEIFKNRSLLHTGDLGMWTVGFVASFVSAFFCVRWLLRYVSHHSFIPFAIYRILFGIAVLATWHFGIVSWSNPG